MKLENFSVGLLLQILIKIFFFKLCKNSKANIESLQCLVTLVFICLATGGNRTPESCWKSGGRVNLTRSDEMTPSWVAFGNFCF